MTDPFVIAETLPHLGYSYGTGTDFWQTLSPTQQALLRNKVKPGASVDATVSADDIWTVRKTQPEGRAYSVALFPGKFESFRNNLAIPGLASPSRSSFIDTQTDILNGRAAAVFTSSGMAFGAQANLYVTTRSVGDPSGTTGAVRTGKGINLYTELKFGQNDQYGFSAPLVIVPVGVTVYVKGSDAITAWYAVNTWTNHNLFEASRHIEQWGMHWSQDVRLTSVNAFNNAALVVGNEGGNASMWMMDAGREAVIQFSGTPGAVGGSLDVAVGLASEKMISPTTNAAEDVAQWAKTAGSTVVSAYDSAVGAIVGAAGAVGDAIGRGFCRIGICL